MAAKTLLESLQLERLDDNLFRGDTPGGALGGEPARIYGGQVVAQALLAAYQTVEGRLCHSLHGYFMRPGDGETPIIYEVDRARDGGSFTTRRVVAIQHGRQIFNMAASFQAPEAGFEHQAPMPAVPDWRDLPPLHDTVRASSHDKAAKWLSIACALEVRDTFPRNPFDKLATDQWEPVNRIWMRAAEALTDQASHHVILAYASDLLLLSTSTRPHPVGFASNEMQQASLDHSLWFHRPLNFNDWLLFAMESPSAAGGRGFNRAEIFTGDGVLAASAAQEGLIRRKPVG